MSSSFDEPTDPGASAPKKREEPDRNIATHIVAINDKQPKPFEWVFAKHFDAMLELMRAFPRDGLLMIGIWRNQDLESYVHIPLGNEPAFGIIGRHERSDLHLSADRSVSLRHLMVSCSRRGASDARVRLWDLASGLGFHTETDVPCEALVCEGPVFVRLSDYHLFLFPTGSLACTEWGQTAKETWNAFPERILLDHRRPARGSRKGKPVMPNDRRARLKSTNGERDSIITRVMPPARPLHAKRRREAEDGIVVGNIQLAASIEALEYAVYDRDLEYGLLVGRYERCHLGGEDKRLSRIHLLIVRDGELVWAIDTASTNGTVLDGEKVRSAQLTSDTEITLGRSIKLRWERVAVGGA